VGGECGPRFQQRAVRIRLNCDRLSSGARNQEQVLLLSKRIQGLEEFAQRQVEELLLLGRFDPPQAAGSRMNEIVRGMLPLLRQLCGEVELGTRLEASGGEVGVSAARLRQVVLNLVLNARDAAGAAGAFASRPLRGPKQRADCGRAFC
jgi:signal transduction histidine kinase